MGSNRIILVAMASALAYTLAGLPSVAQDSLAQPGNQDGIVAVGGVTIHTIRIPAAGMTVSQRADAVMARLRQILADSTLKPSDVVVVALGKNGAEITVKDRLLVQTW